MALREFKPHLHTLLKMPDFRKRGLCNVIGQPRNYSVNVKKHTVTLWSVQG